MSSTVRSIVLGIVLASSLPVLSASTAEMEAPKPLPTLLIKGEVVSVDSSDAAATLVKVKDRYGFETPIYLKTETKIMQGDESAAASALSSGENVEVEYNFDVNTAKRHAVSVKIAAPKAEAPVAAEPAAPAPVAEAAPAPEAIAAPEAAAVAAPAEMAAPAAEAAPAAAAPAETQPASVPAPAAQ